MRNCRRIPSTLAKVLFVLCVGLFAAACQDGSADHGQEDDGLSDGDGMISDDDDDGLPGLDGDVGDDDDDHDNDDDPQEDGDIDPYPDGDEETELDGDEDGDEDREADTDPCDGCLIEGVCISTGQDHPESTCALCDPERDVNGWSPKLQGTECRVAAGVCDVAEVCNGVSNDCPADALQHIGELCNEVDQCDGAGVCVDCIDERGCNDDLNCTTDTCTTDGACTHELNPESCLIDGICYAQNEELSTNRCRYCDVTIMTDGWIYRPSNSDCDDGLYCNGTGDTCNNSGECLHPGSPCPETECEHCNESEDSCYDPVGAACGDSTDTDCDGADTCNGAGNCQSNVAADGAECDLDGIACIVDTCLGGVCIAGRRSDLYCDSDGESWTHEICNRAYDCYDAGWARGFGGTSYDNVYGMTELSDGGLAITGSFNEIIDFDPDNEGGEYESSDELNRIFLAIFDADGSYRWSKSFGEASAGAQAIAQLSNGDLAIVGWFLETIDFDPENDGDEHTSNGEGDIFLAVFDLNGNYRWSKSFGGTKGDWASSILQRPDGTLALIGAFDTTIDFDPEHEGGEYTDYFYNPHRFLAVYDSDGSYRFCKILWGGWTAYSSGIAQLSDGGFAFTGFLQDTNDFNKENEGGEHSSNGEKDIFLTVYNADGSYRWSKTFGGTEYDNGEAVTELSDGGLAITGYFTETIDFDPENEGGEHTSTGYYSNTFLAIFDADGSYRWSKNFGEESYNYGSAITQLSDESLALVGTFDETIDFDPENSNGRHTAHHLCRDLFLVIFDLDGGYRWSQNYGGFNNDGCFGDAVTRLSGRSIAITGSYFGTIDLNIGWETDYLSSNGIGDVFLMRVNPPPVCHDAAATDCSDNGTCTWANGTGMCSCQEGFSGEFCEIEE